MAWIKLHRKLIDSPVWHDERLLKVWMWCLLRASHEERRVIMNGREIVVPIGGFITGRAAGAEACGLPQSTFRNAMQRLVDSGMLASKPDNKKTLYVVVKYADYQILDNENGQQEDNRRTTGGHIQDISISPNGDIQGAPSAPPKQKREKRPPKPPAPLPDPPATLTSREGFTEWWGNWIEHRREIKRPLTPLAAKAAFTELDAMPDPVGAIRYSIARGWQGIFAPKPERQTNGTTNGTTYRGHTNGGAVACTPDPEYINALRSIADPERRRAKARELGVPYELVQ